MIKNKISPEEVINFLNELLKTDRKVIESLFNIRVFCNKKMALHPTVQCGTYGKKAPKYFVGIIGILNGLFGTDTIGWGCLSIDLTKNNKIKKFTLLSKRIKK